jgi:hypothetical protein
VDSLFVHGLGILLGVLFGLLSALGQTEFREETTTGPQVRDDN